MQQPPSSSLAVTADTEMTEEAPATLDAELEAPTRPFSFVRFFAWLGPDYTIFLVFTTLLVVLTFIKPVNFRWRTYTVEASGAICAVMIAIRYSMRLGAIRAGRASGLAELRVAAVRTVQDWGPFFLLALVFANLETYTTFFRDRVIDDFLYAFDQRLFGLQPTVLLSSLDIPLLTDWMAMAYTSYIFTPLVLSALLLLRGRRTEFQEISTAAILQLYIAFVICLVFPAGPPRYYHALVNGGFDPPVLRSYFGLYEVQQISFDRADPLATRSAFPSLHCSLAFFTLFYANKYGALAWPRMPRMFFRLALPLVISLWISVVYLRHHWVADIIAGMLLGWLSCWLAPRLRAWWPKLDRAAEA